MSRLIRMVGPRGERIVVDSETVHLFRLRGYEIDREPAPPAPPPPPPLPEDDDE